MTNRDWLDNLPDDDLAYWLCDSLFSEELSKACGYPIYTGVGAIKSAYNNSMLGLQEWLSEERKDNDGK